MILGAEPLAVSRDPGGAYVDGEYRRGTPEEQFTVVASVQPIGYREVQTLPEGARTKARFIVFADAGQRALRPTDLGVPAGADRVSYRGRTYLVFGVADLTAHESGVPHRAYILAEEGRDG